MGKNMIGDYEDATKQLAVHRRKETSIRDSLEKMVKDSSQLSPEDDNPLDQAYPLVLVAVLAGYSQEIAKVTSLVEEKAPLGEIDPAFLEAKIYYLACEDFINRKLQFYDTQTLNEIAEYQNMSPEEKSLHVDTIKTIISKLAHPENARKEATDLLNRHRDKISNGSMAHYIISRTGGSPEWDEFDENLITLSYSSSGHFEAIMAIRDEYSHQVNEFASAIEHLERMPVVNINEVIFKFYRSLDNYGFACQELMKARPPQTTISVPRRQIDNIQYEVDKCKVDFLRRFHPKYQS